MIKGKPPKDLTPQEMKALSYARDRRNTYGQNDKAWRKLIPIRKAKENGQTRRNTAQAFDSLPGTTEAAADLIQSDATKDVGRVGGWRKAGDRSLAETIARKLKGRLGRYGRQTDLKP